MSSLGTDSRPYLKDPSTGYWMLVDTGAVVTVWPKSDYPDAELDVTLLLEAVNKTRIPTFGKRVRNFKIGRKTYTQSHFSRY